MLSNKDGILTSEIVKLILAVIGFVILGGFAYVLLEGASLDNDFKKAEAHMEIIDEKIGILEEQGSGSFEYPLLNPNGWVLIAFPEFNQIEYNSLGNPIQDFSFEQTCQKCVNNGWEECLCFCPDDSVSGYTTPIFNEQFVSKVGQLANICSEKGYCFEIKQDDVLMFRDRKDWETVFAINDLIKNKENLFINLDSDNLEITTN